MSEVWTEEKVQALFQQLDWRPQAWRLVAPFLGGVMILGDPGHIYSCDSQGNLKHECCDFVFPQESTP